MWSLGIITFSILTGRFPFDDENDFDEVIKIKILKENLVFEPNEF